MVATLQSPRQPFFGCHATLSLFWEERCVTSKNRCEGDYMVGELSTIQTSEKYNALYLSVNVFSTKVLEAPTIFGTAILFGYQSQANVCHLHDQGSTS